MSQKWKLKVYNSFKNKGSKKVVKIDVNSIDDAIEKAQIEIVKGYSDYWEKKGKRQVGGIVRDEITGEIVDCGDHFVIKGNKAKLYSEAIEKEGRTQRGRRLRQVVYKRKKYSTRLEAMHAILDEFKKRLPRACELKDNHQSELKDFEHEWVDMAIIDADLDVRDDNKRFKIHPGKQIEMKFTKDYVVGKFISSKDGQPPAKRRKLFEEEEEAEEEEEEEEAEFTEEEESEEDEPSEDEDFSCDDE
jgi:hypothetical protein